MFTLQQIFILSLVKMKGLTTQAEKCTLSLSMAAMLTNAAYKYKSMEENRQCLFSALFFLVMTKVLLFLGLEIILLNYYLFFLKKTRIKEKKNLYPLPVIFRGIQYNHSSFIECYFCFWAKGILFGGQSSVPTFTLTGSQTAPDETVKQEKLFFLAFPTASSFFPFLNPFQSTLQPGSDLQFSVSFNSFAP